MLFAIALLLPIFFIPGGAISVDFGKISFLAFFALIAFIFWLVGNIRRGDIFISRNPIILSVFAVMLSSAVSAVLSPAVKSSFFGAGFESGTALAVISLSLLCFLFASFFKNREKIILFYALLLVSSFLVFTFQLVKIFFLPDSSLFGLFGSKTSNLLGKWNDLSVLAGLQAVLSLLVIEFFALKKSVKSVVYLVFGLSLLVLSLTNFYLSWILLGLFSAFVFVYAFSFGGTFLPAPSRDEEKRKISWIALAGVLISVAFLLPQSFLGNFLAKNLGIYSVEVRPSWEATIDISRETMKEDLFFGAGPNRFQNQWFLFKPSVVNNTPFWNTSFDSGVGVIPSSAVTGGLLGLLSWASFIIFLLYYGLKTVFNPFKDKLWNFLGLISFSGAAYMFVSAIFYSPGIVNMALGFVMAGIFAAVLAANSVSQEFKIFFVKSPFTSFISVLTSLILIVLSVYGLYAVSSRSLAAYKLGQITLPISTPEVINDAETRTIKALSLYESDYFYRILSDINLTKISYVVKNAKNLSETDTVALQVVLKTAIETAQKAAVFDDTNVGNWISLGRIYADLVPLKIEGAYESAVASYNKALSLSPKDPTIYFSLGRIEVGKGDFAAAKSYFTKALELKSDYTDAAIAISQISVEEGKTEEAASFLERYAASNQNDPVAFYQLGLLKYSFGRYEDAALTLERAVILNPVYADAKFFLGLSYYKLGRNADALVQFEDVLSLNPSNEEVKNIVNSLKNPPAEAPKEADTEKKNP